MAQTNYTPIQLYHSTTPSAVPNPANLRAGELALNTYDGILYFKDTGGVVRVLSTQAGAAANLAGGSTGSIAYQSGVSTTSFLTLGTAGHIVVAGGSAPQYVSPSSLTVGTATNIAGGASGSVPYQTAAGTTALLPAGTNGQVLTISGGLPTWSTSGTATIATNLAGGAAGRIAYQSATDTTAFVAAGTSNQLLISNGTGAPSWVNQSAVAAGTATTATNIAGGVLGSIPYQTSTNNTIFLPLGVTNYVLTAGIAGPQYVSPSTLSVGSATTATNLSGGGAGSIPYQSASGTTAFLSAGTAGYVLTSNGTSAPTWAAASGGVSLSGNNTWTNTQSFVGSTSAVAEKLKNAAELVNVVATAIPASPTIYISSGAVTYYTSEATSNFSLTFSFSPSINLPTAMLEGDAITAAVLVKTSASAGYYCTGVNITGGSTTTVWLGGAPTSGSFNTNNIDVYTFTIIKTTGSNYTVLAAQSSYI